MKALVVFAALAMSLQCLPAYADCTLAFAPPALRHAASEHYYRSSRRDSIPPGHLPAADRQEEVRENGKAKPNDNVLAQMNNTAAEQQRNLTLVAATIAEQQRKLEQEAKADADNAYRNKMGLSPELYLARQLAEIQAEACKAAVACYLVPQGTNVVVK